MHNFCKKIADEVQIISHIQYQTCVKNFNCLMRNNGSLVGHVTATLNARWHAGAPVFRLSKDLRKKVPTSIFPM